MSQIPDNRRLVREAQNGDREAFKAIYECYGPRVYNFLCRLLGSRHEAEDVTQQTFMIALHRLGSLRDPDLLESWIYRIARNEIYQKYRRKQVDSLEDEYSKRFAERAEDQHLNGQPEKTLLNQELKEALQSALNNLPLKLREVFILAVVDEMSYKDISEIVGRSLLSVKTDIYRARLMTKDKLGRYIAANKKVSVNKSVE
jgi:RNA polymerase sigma-70 factor, ECF subfamily